MQKGGVTTSTSRFSTWIGSNAFLGKVACRKATPTEVVFVYKVHTAFVVKISKSLTLTQVVRIIAKTINFVVIVCLRNHCNFFTT